MLSLRKYESSETMNSRPQANTIDQYRTVCENHLRSTVQCLGGPVSWEPGGRESEWGKYCCVETPVELAPALYDACVGSFAGDVIAYG